MMGSNYKAHKYYATHSINHTNIYKDILVAILLHNMRNYSKRG